MKTSLSDRFCSPQTTPVVSSCQRIRGSISYKQPSTVSGEAQRNRLVIRFRPAT